MRALTLPLLTATLLASASTLPAQGTKPKVKTPAPERVVIERDKFGPDVQIFARGGARSGARSMIGVSTSSTGTRDTLGLLVTSVTPNGPAEKAGIVEGNRIAAINGVNLRVGQEDAGDRWMSNTKAQRLQREVSALKPGDNVTLKVYANGKFRDVTLKAARAGDLPRSASMFLFDGNVSGVPMPAMPSMPAMPMEPMTPMAPIAPMPSIERMELLAPTERVRMQDMPDLRRILDGVRVQLRNIRPQIERSLQASPRVRGYNVIV